jgi:uncharacterized membrane protein HdeD (DUF308 family)
MLQIASRIGQSITLRGVAAVLFGVTALAWPGVTLLTLIILFGAYALVDGLVAFWAAASPDRPARGRGWLVAEGVVGVATGVVTVAWPAATGLVLLWLVAGWAMALGVLRIAAAVRLRSTVDGSWLLALNGVLAVAFGVLLAARPSSGALAVVVVIGVYAIVSGTAQIGTGQRLRRVGRARPAAVREPAAH